MNITYVGFNELYKPLYTRFINSYIKEFLPTLSNIFFERFIFKILATDQSAHGITGYNQSNGSGSITVYLQDGTRNDLALFADTRVISHELCHGITEFLAIGADMHRFLHSYDGEFPTKDVREILSDFNFRAKYRTWALPRIIKTKVIDWNKLKEAYMR